MWRNRPVSSPTWDDGANIDTGAITFGNGTTGIVGFISSSNSLVGASSGDRVGSIFTFSASRGVTPLPGGNYVISSPFWNDGPRGDVGAVTFADGTVGTSGVVSPLNSFIGSASNDQVGSEGVTALANGNFVIRSPDWNNGTIVDAGAVTFVDSSATSSGVVSIDNSLVGSSADDQIGSERIVTLENGNFFVDSLRWDNGTVVDVGAFTFGSGISGLAGTISPANSLIGSATFDLGVSFVRPAAAGDGLVVVSIFWANGLADDAGAVTFGSALTGVSGVISSANSLVGSSESDMVGDFVTTLSNGNFVVASPRWDNGSLAGTGAVTFIDGIAGIAGVVSTENSVIGQNPNSRLGRVRIDNTNDTFIASFSGDDGGRVLVGSQENGFVPSDVSIDSLGNLQIESRDDSSNDDLTISREGSNYRISDPSNELQPGLGTFLADNGDVLISAASVTGAILINGNNGDDVLTIDFTGGNPIPASGISFDGGVGGNDSLAIVGGSAVDVVHNFVNANDGSVEIDGSLLTYVGLEPIFDNLDAVDREFNFLGGNETISVTADANPLLTRIDSTLGESVSFTNPTSSLTINSTNGLDTINFDGVGSGFDAAVNITTDDDIVNLNAALSLGSSAPSNTGNLSVDAASIFIGSNAAIDTSNATANGQLGNVSLTAGRSISMVSGASITTEGGDITLEANTAATETGDFTAARIDGAIEATGTGAISVTGVGGLGTDGNTGIQIFGSTARIRSAGGGIALTGRGQGSGDSNSGVSISGSAVVEDTANGAINITGESAGSGAGNHGFALFDATTTVRANNGDVSVVGVGGGTSGLGIILNTAAQLSTTVGGDISLTGTPSNASADAIQFSNFQTGFSAAGDASITANTSPFTTTNVDLSATATTLSGAFSPGGVITTRTNVVGDLAFGSGSFVAQVNGNVPATEHDQVSVSGSVDLNNVALDVTGTIPTNAGQTILLIDNDGTDSVVGTFSGLDQGAAVSINGVDFAISYQGGDGNDVTLSQVVGDTFDGTAAAEEFTLLVVATDVVLRVDGTDVLSFPIGNNPTYTINGFGGEDRLIVDLSGGNPIPSGGLFFNGGDPTVGTGDSLEVTGGSAGTITHTFLSENDGSINLDGSVINYTGLEPIVDNMNAVNRVFNFEGGSETISLSDDAAIVGNNLIDSTLGESVSFTNPTATLTINSGDGDDAINVTTLDLGNASSLLVDGGDGANDLLSMTDVNLINTPGRGLTLNELEVISVSGASISGNTATIGGGVLINNSTSSTTTATFDDVAIFNNTATGGTAPLDGGGGIYNRGANLSVLNGSRVAGNSAISGSASGGGIFSTGTLTIVNSAIVGNDAGLAGGGIEIAAGSSLTSLTGVTISQNNAGSSSGNGGGLHVSGAGDVTMLGGTVNNNTAALSGGGISNGTGTMTINFTPVLNNIASGAGADNGGGGIFNAGGDLTVLNGVRISGNTADGALGSGGGIHSAAGSVTITDSALSGNTASNFGGGIHSQQAEVAVSNSLVGGFADPNGLLVEQFDSNAPVDSLVVADGLIGAGVLTASAISRTINFADDPNDASFTNFGGAVPFPASGNMNSSDPLNDDFALRTSGFVRIPTSGQWSFGFNADDGGRLRINGVDVAVLDGLNAATNALGTIDLAAGIHSIEAVYYERAGGAVFELFAAEGQFTQFNDSFRLIGDVQNGGLAASTSAESGNSAGTDGGGIHVAGTTTTSIQTSVISGNRAGRSGGGIGVIGDAQGGTLTIIDSTIQNNVSTGDAGGIASQDVSLFLTDTTVSDNSAGDSTAVPPLLGRAGGIGVLGVTRTPVLSAERVTIDNNKSADEGGGVALLRAGLAFTNVTVTDNESTAGTGGGLVYDNTDSSVTRSIAFSTFASNTDPSFPSNIAAFGAPIDMLATLFADGTGLFGAGFTFNSLGYNVNNSMPPGLTDPTDINMTDVSLASLADNGGPVQTRAFVQTDEVINRVPPAIAGLDVDARGVPRIGRSDLADVGAFEFAEYLLDFSRPNEGDGSFAITVGLDRELPEPYEINVDFGDAFEGTFGDPQIPPALLNSDYVATDTMLSFPAGPTSPQTITITLVDDGEVEPDEEALYITSGSPIIGYSFANRFIVVDNDLATINIGGEFFADTGMGVIDFRNNGIKEDGEGTLPLSDIELELVALGLDGTLGTIDDLSVQTTRSNDGNYQFTNVPAGSYVVVIGPDAFRDGNLLDGFSVSTVSFNPNSGVDNNNDGQAITQPNLLSGGLVSGVIDASSSSPGNLSTSVDFGFVARLLTAADIARTIDEDSGEISVDLSTLVANQSGAITYSIASASSGTASVAVDMLFYTPDANFFGQATVVYQAADNIGSAQGTITFDVLPVDDDPIASDDNFSVPFNAVSAPLDVLANDFDVDGDTDTLTIAFVGEASNGTTSLSASGVVIYTPDIGFTGTDSFVYDINDVSGRSSAATVFVTVTDPAVLLTGTVFCDANINGLNDPGEAAADAMVFLDVNRNGVFDEDQDESMTLTDSLGNYTFSTANPGDSRVVLVVPDGCGLPNEFVEQILGITLGDIVRDILVADVDRDGNEDLLAVSDRGEELLLFSPALSRPLGDPISLPGRPQHIDVWTALPDPLAPNSPPSVHVAVASVGGGTILLGGETITEDDDTTRPGFGSIYAIDGRLPTEIPGMGDGPIDVVVNDFDRDNKPDYVSAAFRSDEFWLQLSSQSTPTLVSTGDVPVQVEVGFFNDDGLLDLALGSRGYTNTSGTIEIRFGDESGGFTPGPIWRSAGKLVDLISANLSSLDRPFQDELVAIDEDGKLTVFSVDAGGLEELDSLTLEESTSKVRIGDIDGDSNLDVVVVRPGPGEIDLLLGNGTGSLIRGRVSEPTPMVVDVAFADLDGSGRDSLILASLSNSNGQSDGVTNVLRLSAGQQNVSIIAGATVRADFAPSTLEARMDVNGDESVTVLDALQVINEINANASASRQAGEPVSETIANTTVLFDFGNPTDIDRDGQTSALDALMLINYLNEQQRSVAASAEPLQWSDTTARKDKWSLDQIDRVMNEAGGLF